MTTEAIYSNFSDSLGEIRTCGDTGTLCSAISRAAEKLNFPHHSYVWKIARNSTDETKFTASNFTISQKKNTDPIISTLFSNRSPSNITPIISPIFFDVDGNKNGEGVFFPVHDNRGGTGILTLTRDAERDYSFKDDYRIHALGLLLCATIHERVLRFSNDLKQPKRDTLTTREAECLKWIAAGKSSYEISVILGISTHGVIYHVRKIMHKLEANSRFHAVVRANAYGLL